LKSELESKSGEVKDLLKEKSQHSESLKAQQEELRRLHEKIVLSDR